MNKPKSNRNNRGRGYKPKNKESYSDKDTLQQGCDKAVNDISWYAPSEQILQDVARIPYNIPVGMPFARYGTFTPSGVTLQSYDDALPGLFVSRIMPCLGNAYTPSDAVNVAANSVYQFVRSKISGSRNYDAVDMMIYLGAMDSVYCYVTWLTRLYSTVFTYHQANRYLAKALVEAQHVDYDDLVSNLANFRANVNMRIAKVRALYLPSILPIFKRHAWIFSNYFIEGPTEKDQIYFHVPEGIHLFQYDSSGAGMLHAYRFDRTLSRFTTANLLTMLDAMIDPIYQDEDFNRISGDFLKAYEGNVFTLSELPDISTITLNYNVDVLKQFHNAKYKYIGSVNGFDDRFEGDFFDYHQDPNHLYLQKNIVPTAFDRYMAVNSNGNNVSSPVLSTSTQFQINLLASSNYEWSKTTMLTSPNSEVSASENMENTRLVVAFEIEADSTSFWEGSIKDAYFGTEWPICFDIVTFHRDRVTHVTSTFTRHYDRTLTIDKANFNGVQQLLESQLPILSAFKYIPELSIIVGDSSSGQTLVYNAGRNMFDVDNYALVASNTISGMHNAAILGEYNIPGLAIGK